MISLVLAMTVSSHYMAVYPAEQEGMCATMAYFKTENRDVETVQAEVIINGETYELSGSPVGKMGNDSVVPGPIVPSNGKECRMLEWQYQTTAIGYSG